MIKNYILKYFKNKTLKISLKRLILYEYVYFSIQDEVVVSHKIK